MSKRAFIQGVITSSSSSSSRSDLRRLLMKQRRSHIKSVFGVAIVIGVVWYIANSSTIINGKGWFERQQFPLNNHLACVVIGALVVAISIQISALVRWYRKSSMQLAAGVNGMSFEATFTKSELEQARSAASSSVQRPRPRARPHVGALMASSGAGRGRRSVRQLRRALDQSPWCAGL